MNVTIANDDILEGEEDFFSTLTATDPDLILLPDEAQVIIIEDPNDSTFYVVCIYILYQCTVTI